MATPPRDPTPKQKGKASAIIPPPSGGGAAAARRQREGARRLEKLSQFYLAQQMHGLSRRGAARFIRVSHLSLWKWERKILSGGFANLVSRRKGPPLSRAVQFGLQPAIISRVQWLAVLKGSSPAGWRAFANDPSCPAELRSAIQPGCAIPEALRSAVRVERRVVTVRVAVLRSGSFTCQHQLKGRRRAALRAPRPRPPRMFPGSIRQRR